MIPGGMGWIIVDALDTLIMMNLTSRVQHARNWIQNSLDYSQKNEVNTFETTIRMLGGLLSAHYLSTKYPQLAPLSDDDTGSPGEDLYIEKAADLADRLLGAFDTKSGVPFASVNLNTSEGIESHLHNGASSTSEATSLQLEFKYLAKLTGESEYWQAVEKVMQVVDDQKMRDGLVPIHIHPGTGLFQDATIGLGSRGDSYYGMLRFTGTLNENLPITNQKDRISHQAIPPDLRTNLQSHVGRSPRRHPQAPHHVQQTWQTDRARGTTTRPGRPSNPQNGPPSLLPARHDRPRSNRRTNPPRSQKIRNLDTPAR